MGGKNYGGKNYGGAFRTDSHPIGENAKQMNSSLFLVIMLKIGEL